MKLSMWILKKVLESFDPVAIIISGEQVISGARLFSHNTPPDREYLYIGRSKDFFDDSPSREILLMHRQDVISLQTYDLEDVFNVVTEAFEYYNRWENTLLTESQLDQPEQRIIDACKDIFGPMFILDNNMNLIAASKDYTPGTVNPWWDDMLNSRTISVDFINHIKKSSFLSMISVPRKRMLFDCEPVGNYIHGILISYLSEEKKMIGQMVISSKEPMTEYEFQLSGTVERALNVIKQKRASNPASSITQGMLLDLLAGVGADKSNVSKLLACQGWHEQDRFCIVRFEGQQSDEPYTLHVLMERIARVFPNDCIIAPSTSNLVGCLRVNQKEFFEKIQALLLRTGLRCGISFVFDGLHKICEQDRQAQSALRVACKTDAGVVSFGQCALSVLMRTFDSRSFQLCCVHPVLEDLSRYDKENATEYYPTLRVYLQCERRYTLAAEVLRIHRNTLIYRIGRILELFALNLDDREEREYLLISYRILDKSA